MWAERPGDLLQSPLFRRQQVPIPHSRAWASTPAASREPRAAGRPRPDSPGRKMGAPQDFDSHHCCGAYKARVCQRVSLAEAARPKGRAPPYSREAHGGDSMRQAVRSGKPKARCRRCKLRWAAPKGGKRDEFCGKDG